MKKKAKRKPSAPAPQPEFIPGSWELPVAGGLILVFTALLLFAARGDYWLDEVLSFQWASAAENAWQLVQVYRHDNNHPLNSFWLMLVGEQRPPIIGRLLSVGSGVGALFLLWKIGQIIAPRAAVIPLAVAASSFPLILYFSEARGYAPAIFFTLLCTWLIFSTPGKFNLSRAVCFWFSGCLAILAHGTSIYILAALGIWWVVRECLDQVPLRLVGLSSMLWFAVPAGASAGFYFYYLKEMMVAGGPEYTVLTVVGQFFEYALGSLLASAGGVAAIIVAICLLSLSLWRGNFQHRANKLFFVMVLIVLPGFGLIFSGAEYLYFRYFLVCLPFFYLMLGPLAAQWIQNHGSAGRWLAGGLVLVIFIGQCPLISSLMQHGRGQYSAALQAVARESGTTAVVSSDHDFRNGLIVEFHRRNTSEMKLIDYQLMSAEGASSPAWLITHSQEPDYQLPDSMLEAFNGVYELHSTYRSGPVSGFHWFLYQLKN